MDFTKRLLALPTCALLLAGAAAAQSTWLVGPGPHADFSTIQSGIQGASDGDVLLLLPGAEAGGALRISGKGLTLTSSTPMESPLPGITVSGVPATSFVLLRNLFFRSGSPGAITAAGCQGSVRIESCHASGTVALHATQCADVSLIRTSLVGVSGPSFSPPAAATLYASASLIVADDCSIVGGRGEDGQSGGFFCILEPGDGRAAVAAFDSSIVWVSGGSIHGGLPGNAPGACTSAVEGPALFASGGSRVIYRGTTTFGPTLTPGGSVVPLGEAARSVTLESWTQSAGVIEVTAQGEPGETVIGLFADQVGRRYLGDPVGVYQAPQVVPGGRFLLGTLDASGSLTTVIAAPAVTSGTAKPFFLQAGFLGASGSVRLAPLQSTIVLGPQPPVLLGGTVVRVDPTAPPGGDGKSWSTAYGNLSTALGLVWPLEGSPTTLWLREGRYRPASTGAYFRVGPGVRLVGGFAGTETLESERDAVAHRTWIDGDLFGDDGPQLQNRQDNAERLIEARGTAALPVELLGLGIRGSYSASSPAVTIGASGTMEECLLTQNLSSEVLQVASYGADADVHVLNCTVEGNYRGGIEAALSDGSRVEFAGLLVRANVLLNSALVLQSRDSSRVSLINSSVVQNRLGRGAVYTFRGSASGEVRVENSILWDNVLGGTSSYDAQCSHFGLTGPETLRASLVQHYPGDPAQTGTTDRNPLFLDRYGFDGIPGTGDENFRLQSGSPGVDSGNNGAVPSALLVDLDGRPRLADDPTTPDTGQGTAPIVDRGAFER